MRPVEYRKFIRELRKLCKTHGIDFKIVNLKGSHRGLVFIDVENEARAVNTTVVEDREISPGVQRDMLKALARYGVHEAVADLAEQVHQIVEDLLSGTL